MRVWVPINNTPIQHEECDEKGQDKSLNSLSAVIIEMRRIIKGARNSRLKYIFIKDGVIV
jgi:hypothetical protein